VATTTTVRVAAINPLVLSYGYSRQTVLSGVSFAYVAEMV